MSILYQHAQRSMSLTTDQRTSQGQSSWRSKIILFQVFQSLQRTIRATTMYLDQPVYIYARRSNSKIKKISLPPPPHRLQIILFIVLWDSHCNNPKNPRAKNSNFLKLFSKTLHGKWTYEEANHRCTRWTRIRWLSMCISHQLMICFFLFLCLINS
jgi:hypothetical protein